MVRDLVVWANARGHCSKLYVPWFDGHHASRNPVDLKARWQMAHRLLHDDGLDVTDRVAGALVVLYAQPITRIARLTRPDVIDKRRRGIRSPWYRHHQVASLMNAGPQRSSQTQKYQ